MYSYIFKVQRAKMKGDPTIAFAIYIQPVIFALLFGYIAHVAGHRNTDLLPICIGVAQMAMWQVVLYAGGIIVRHEFNRERTSIFTILTKFSLYRLWSTRLLMCMTLALPVFVVTALVGFIAFGIRIQIGDVPRVLFGILFFFISLYSIGLPLIFLLFLTVHGGRVIQTLSYPIYLLSGMIVSINHFPMWLQCIARVFPISWSTHWLQTAVTLHRFPEWECLGGLSISTIYILLSVVVYRVIMKKLRIRGDIQL